MTKLFMRLRLLKVSFFIAAITCVAASASAPQSKSVETANMRRAKALEQVRKEALPTAYGGSHGRITLRGIPKNKVPSETDLRRSGQLGGPLSPTRNAEPALIDNPQKRQRQERENRSFGNAMELWNAHDYAEAVEAFKKHRQDFPDSAWGAESELHMGCEAQFNGRWAEAQTHFDWVIANAPKGSDMYQKGLLRKGVLLMERNQIAESKAMFAKLLQTEKDWRRRTYAQGWIRHLNMLGGELKKVRTCGAESVAFLLEKRGEAKKAKKLREQPAHGEYGYSLGELQALAQEEGFMGQAVYIAPEKVGDLPLPHIAHYKDNHFVAVNSFADGKYEVYDSRLKRTTQLTKSQLSQMASGLVLLFNSQLPNDARLATADEILSVGGCCGIPKPEDDKGPCNEEKKDCSKGMPIWSVNPINMNLYVQDIPIWYDAPYGPDFEFYITYNSLESLDNLSPVGSKWALNYAGSAMIDPSGNVTVVMPGGRNDVYRCNGTTYSSPVKHAGYTLEKTATYSYTVTDPDGDRYFFAVPSAMSATGGNSSLLVAIEDKYANRLSITHNADGQITKVTTADNKEFNFTYNAAGLISQVTDPWNRTATFAYETILNEDETEVLTHNLISQKDMNGIEYSYEYNNKDAIEKHKLPLGTNTISGTIYDDNGDPMEGVTVYIFGGPTTTTDLNGEYLLENLPNQEMTLIAVRADYGQATGTLYGYDLNSSGFNLSIFEGEWGNWRADTQSDYFLSKISYPGNRVYQFATEPADGISNNSSSYPQSGAPMWENYRITITDPIGQKSEYYYNGYFSYSWFRDAAQYYPITDATFEEAPKTDWFFSSVDNKGVIQCKTFADGNSIYYDDFDALIGKPQRVADARGNSTYYTYNARGNVLTQSNYEESSSETDYYKTEFQYAANGRDITAIIHYDATNSTGLTLSTLTYSYPANAGLDTPGILTAATQNRTGVTTTYSYYTSGDNANRGLLRQEVITGGGITITTVYNRDANGRMTSIVRNGATISSTTYDSIGRVATQTDANGFTLAYTYNNANKVTAVLYPDGTQESYQWDCCHIEKVTDRIGRVTVNDYDALKNLIAVHAPDKHTTQYGYDKVGNLISLTDPAGNTTTWTYNARYWPTAKTYADGTSVGMTYDANGNQLTYTNARNTVVSHGYDALNRVVTTSATGNYPFSATTSYDALNRITQIKDSTGTYSYAYNATTLQMQSLTLPVGTGSAMATIAYAYDGLGRPTAATLSGGWTTGITYDTLQRMATAGNGLGTFTLSYAEGKPMRVASVSAPNGLATHYAYEADGLERLSRIQNLNASNGVVSQFDYGYDTASRISQWARNLGGVTSTYSFAYDAIDQLTQTALSVSGTTSLSAQKSYRYDKAGNRQEVASNGVYGQEKYNNLNQLTERNAGSGGKLNVLFSGTTSRPSDVWVAKKRAHNYANNYFEAEFLMSTGSQQVEVLAIDAAGKKTVNTYSISVQALGAPMQYRYDADGNLTDDGAYTYEWDALSRLMALEEKGTAAGRKRLEFAYNALNQRVRITAKTYTNGAWVVDEENSAAFVWMDTSIAQKRTLDGETVVRNYYPQGFTAHGADANDQLTITKFFYTKDHLGSIREVVGNDGATVYARIDYDAWGNITSETNSAGNAATVFSDFTYTGHFRHAYASHLVFAMYRAYAPEIGRWISRDPIGELGGLNLYGYVGNNAVNLFDPEGLFFGLDDAIAATVGAIIGVAAQGISDAISGETSSWESYAGAAIGGAAAGFSVLYTGGIGAGAIGGAVTSYATQFFETKNGKRCAIDGGKVIDDALIGAATGGLMKGMSIKGVTTGKNSNNAIFKQMRTKAKNGTASSITPKTGAKMVDGRFTDKAMGRSGIASTMVSNFLNDIEAETGDCQ